MELFQRSANKTYFYDEESAFNTENVEMELFLKSSSFNDKNVDLRRKCSKRTVNVNFTVFAASTIFA